MCSTTCGGGGGCSVFVCSMLVGHNFCPEHSPAPLHDTGDSSGDSSDNSSDDSLADRDDPSIPIPSSSSILSSSDVGGGVGGSSSSNFLCDPTGSSSADDANGSLSDPTGSSGGDGGLSDPTGSSGGDGGLSDPTGSSGDGGGGGLSDPTGSSGGDGGLSDPTGSSGDGGGGGSSSSNFLSTPAGSSGVGVDVGGSSTALAVGDGVGVVGSSTALAVGDGVGVGVGVVGSSTALAVGDGVGVVGSSTALAVGVGDGVGVGVGVGVVGSSTALAVGDGVGVGVVGLCEFQPMSGFEFQRLMQHMMVQTSQHVNSQLVALSDTMSAVGAQVQLVSNKQNKLEHQLGGLSGQVAELTRGANNAKSELTATVQQEVAAARASLTAQMVGLRSTQKFPALQKLKVRVLLYACRDLGSSTVTGGVCCRPALDGETSLMLVNFPLLMEVLQKNIPEVKKSHKLTLGQARLLMAELNPVTLDQDFHAEEYNKFGVSGYKQSQIQYEAMAAYKCSDWNQFFIEMSDAGYNNPLPVDIDKPVYTTSGNSKASVESVECVEDLSVKCAWGVQTCREFLKNNWDAYAAFWGLGEDATVSHFTGAGVDMSPVLSARSIVKNHKIDVAEMAGDGLYNEQGDDAEGGGGVSGKRKRKAKSPGRKRKSRKPSLPKKSGPGLGLALAGRRLRKGSNMSNMGVDLSEGDSDGGNNGDENVRNEESDSDDEANEESQTPKMSTRADDL